MCKSQVRINVRCFAIVCQKCFVFGTGNGLQRARISLIASASGHSSPVLDRLSRLL